MTTIKAASLALAAALVLAGCPTDETTTPPPTVADNGGGSGGDDGTGTPDGATGGDDAGTTTGGETDTGVLPDGAETPDPGTEPGDGDVATVPDEGGDVPSGETEMPDAVDTSDTTPDTTGGCIPADDPCCNNFEGCKTLHPLVTVCVVSIQQTFPSDCIAKCQGHVDEDIALGQCDPCPECADVSQNPIDLCHEPTTTNYTSFYEACCDKGYTMADLTPGKCQGQACEQGCPDEYAPICAKDQAGALSTWDNACLWSQCDTTGSFVCAGECADTAGCPACDAEECAPVCGVDGNTYPSLCFAQCGGTQKAYEGQCCDCPPPVSGEEVCGASGTTHGNLCLLDCKLDVYSYAGECIPGCQPGADDPEDGVCGNLLGEFKSFPNVSCANAAGATCVFEGLCALELTPCKESNQEYAPVCATLPGTTTKQTFANACWAGCAGATGFTSGVCADCTTQCAAAEAKAHCSKDDCVLYPNACVPEKCTGQAAASLVKNECPVECTVTP